MAIAAEHAFKEKSTKLLILLLTYPSEPFTFGHFNVRHPVKCTCVSQYRDFSCRVVVFGFEKILEIFQIFFWKGNKLLSSFPVQCKEIWIFVPMKNNVLLCISFILNWLQKVVGNVLPFWSSQLMPKVKCWQ